MKAKDLLNGGNFFGKYTGTMSIERVCENTIWLIRLRWIACIGLLFGVILSKAFFKVEIKSVLPPLLIGIGIIIFNFIFYLRYSFLSKRRSEQTKECVEKRLIFVNIQIFVDLIMLTAIIYYTGGIATPIPFFFIFHMVISSIMLSKINAYFWAVFTIITQSIMIYLEHSGKIAHKYYFYFIPEINDKSGYTELFILIVFSITLVITVYFATTIMRPIRKKQLDLTIMKNELQEQKYKLESTNAELEDMDKSKTEFLYRVEHELKAPIAAILSMLSVVIRGYDSVDENKKKDFLNRSIIRVKSMKDMVKDLLSLSRVDAKNFQLNKTDLKFYEIIEEIIDELTPYAQKKNIGLKTNLADKLPDFYADRDALTEIIRNLIHNAIKYSFEGFVTIALVMNNNELIFSVLDTGIGISEDDLGNIFEEFYRTSNAKAFEEGTGLGLALVKKLVEQLGGNIKIESELNKGTKSIISFPV